MNDLDALGGVARNLGYIIGLISTMATLFVAWLYYRLKDKFVTRGEHDKHTEKISSTLMEHENRLNGGQRHFGDLKSDMKNFATKGDVHKVELAVKELEGDQKATLEAIKGIKSTLELMVEQQFKKDKS